MVATLGGQGTVPAHVKPAICLAHLYVEPL